MSELHFIEHTLKRAASRRRLDRALRGLWRGLLVGGIVWLVVLGAYKISPLPLWSLTAASFSAGLCVLAGVVIGGWRASSLIDTARWVDQQKHLQERLSTALEVAPSSTAGDWKDLLVTDAAKHAGDLDPRKILPFHLPAVSRWALLILLLGAGLGFVPEYRSKEFLQKQHDAANIKDTGKQLLELTRRTLKDHPPALEPTQKALTDLAALGDQLAKNQLTKTEALRDLASVADKLNQQAKELGQNQSLKPLERAARENAQHGSQSPGDLQKQIEAMQKALGNASANPDALDKLKKELQKLQQAAANLPDKDSAAGKAAREQMSEALSELAKQARELGQPLESLEEAIAALQANQTDTFLRDLKTALNDLDKLKDLAKAMQQLQQQAGKMGKDLAEQLKNGQAQAAQATLEKMVKQLQEANLSPEQLDKILDEVAKAINPAGQYGKVADFLKEGVKQLKQGQKPDAAQSLAAAAKELEKLAESMSDAEALADALDALNRAQMAIATGKSWSQCQAGACSNCQGAGCSLCRGKGWGHGGRPGRGVGTWAEETGWLTYPEISERWDNTGVERPDMAPRGQTDRGDGELSENAAPTKVKGQISPGGQMPSITLKGVSIKGQSSVSYQEAVATAQTEAQSALNQDKVPRAYQGAVKNYFDDLKK